jgi:hypothetical protein
LLLCKWVLAEERKKEKQKKKRKNESRIQGGYRDRERKGGGENTKELGEKEILSKTIY